MRESSNPVMKNLTRGFNAATNHPGAAQAGMYGAQQYGQQGQYGQPYGQPYAPPTPATRSITIDDIVTKTGMTLGVVALTAVVAYALSAIDVAYAMPLLLIGGIGGFVLVLIAMFGRKMDNPAIVLSYAAFEGLFVGAASFVFANLTVGSTSAGALITQALLATFGVFFGMLVVYKTGAIRVTPRFTRMIFAGMVGVLVLALGNLVLGMFGVNMGLRDGGPIAIIFSLICIGLAAFSFLIDFDSADQLIRAGAPAKAAWGVALGLTITLVWLYIEILRLLSYFNND